MGVKVLWNYEAPEGGGDSYSSFVKGTKASFKTVQDKFHNYIKELYIVKEKGISEKDFKTTLDHAIARLQKTYPFVSAKPVDNGTYLIHIPLESRKGHEDYFGYVAQRFFTYLVEQNMPEWEIKIP